MYVNWLSIVYWRNLIKIWYEYEYSVSWLIMWNIVKSAVKLFGFYHIYKCVLVNWANQCDKLTFRFGVDYWVYERALFFLVAADSPWKAWRRGWLYSLWRDRFLRICQKWWIMSSSGSVCTWTGLPECYRTGILLSRARLTSQTVRLRWAESQHYQEEYSSMRLFL